MKIVIAPQAYKGSITALGVAIAAEKGALKVFPDAEVLICPVADGGDGTLETLVEGSEGEINETNVTGPTGKRLDASWGAMGDGKTAVIEMARSSGLALLALDERDPLHSTTFGLGEVILQALDQGFRNFIVGIGGSATNDAGAGMAQALGVKLLDENGKQLPPGGASLDKLTEIDLSGIDSRIQYCDFQIACDVNNPLTGPEGASAVYGPQKGATPDNVKELDMALGNFSDVVKSQLGKDVKNIPGAGAAGGLGAGMIAFLDGHLRAGVDIVLDAVELKTKMDGARLVITGEGGMDFQTIYNKAPIGVARLASEMNIPCFGISGMLGENYQVVHEHGLESALSIVSGPMTLEEASSNAAVLIENSVEEALRLIRIGMSL